MLGVLERPSESEAEGALEARESVFDGGSDCFIEMMLSAFERRQTAKTVAATRRKARAVTTLRPALRCQMGCGKTQME